MNETTVVVATPEQLEKFAADDRFEDAVIPTKIRFSSWHSEGSFTDSIMITHVGTFIVTGYNSSENVLTFRKMNFHEKVEMWIDKNKSSLVIFGKSLPLKIKNILKRLVNF